MLVIQPNLEPIPGYRIITRLGRGGCGEVWKAEAPGGVFKAIKFVFGDLDGFAQNSGSAEQEQRSLERVKNIRHPFILSTERFEVVEGQLVIVMELADGNLAERFEHYTAQKLPGIPREELLRYMEEAAEALDLMNSVHQIQHMDIKPQNIFLVQQHVKVGDFGLAKNLEGTRAALTGGMTPIYAPPESFDGWVSRQSDQYSLAIVYQEMLTGIRPFNGANSRQLIMQHLSATPNLTALAPADRGPVSRALAKRPEERFASCRDFVKSLRSGEYAPAASARSSGLFSRPVDEQAGNMRLTRRSAPAVVPNGKPGLNLERADATRRLTDTSSRPTQAQRGRSRVLFPAIVVGIGAAGLGVIQQFRRFLFDSHRSSILPHLRCFYIDCDPSALDAATSGRPEVKLSPDEIFTVAVPAIDPDNKERNPVGTDTQMSADTFGSTGHLPTGRGQADKRGTPSDRVLTTFLNHVRTALREITSLEALIESSRRTQLEVRSKTPRIYVAADLGELLSSTLLVDLAYALKNELRALGLNPNYMIGLLTLPASDNTKARECARRALGDLEHFDGSDTIYKSQLEASCELVSDDEPPFGRCLVFEDDSASARAAHLVFAETSSLAGQALQSVRCPRVGHHYFGANFRRVLWPRAAVLDGAARQLAHDVLKSWATFNTDEIGDYPERVALKFWRDGRMELALLRAGLDYGASQRLHGPLESLLHEKLNALGVGSGVECIDLLTAQIAFDQMADWLKEAQGGNGGIAAAFESRGLEIVAEIDLKLAPLVASLLQSPGQRVAAARQALGVLETLLQDELGLAQKETESLTLAVQSTYQSVRERLILPIPPGKSLHRKQVIPGEFSDQLVNWAKARIRQMRENAVADTYAQLLASIPEFTREVEALADRLDALSLNVDTMPDLGLPADGVCEYIFPFAAESADDAITQLLIAIGESGRREFDEILQSKLRSSGKGVIQLAIRPEWGPKLVDLIVGEAGRFVEERTNRMSVSQALYKHFNDPTEFKSYVNHLLAAPEGSLVSVKHEVTFFGVPDDSAGQQISDLIRKHSDDPTILQFSSSNEISLGRLSGGLNARSIRMHLDRPVGDRVLVGSCQLS